MMAKPFTAFGAGLNSIGLEGLDRHCLRRLAPQRVTDS